jgi:hypothetical protein
MTQILTLMTLSPGWFFLSGVQAPGGGESARGI